MFVRFFKDRKIDKEWNLEWNVNNFDFIENYKECHEKSKIYELYYDYFKEKQRKPLYQDNLFSLMDNKNDARLIWYIYDELPSWILQFMLDTIRIGDLSKISIICTLWYDLILNDLDSQTNIEKKTSTKKLVK